MNRLKRVKNLYKHLIALFLFLLITVGFTWPTFLGKSIEQPDIIRFKAMSKELVDYRTEKGEEALWTNNMFGGMPAYQISVVYKGNLISYVTEVQKVLFKHPVYAIFLSMLCFYILLLSLRVDYRLAIIGAVAYAFSTYFIIILKAGHNSKAITLAYSPLVLAGFVLAFRRKKYWLSFLITCLGLSLSLSSGHQQMTFYLGLIVFIYVLFEAYHHIVSKTIKAYFVSCIVVLGAMFLAIGTDYARFSSVYSYAQKSIRGDRALIQDDSNNAYTGVDKSYITDWSYGATETLTFLIPNYKGGISKPIVLDHKKLLQSLPKGMRKHVGQIDAYYGNQPFTDGPVYLGAFVVFLFVLSLFFLDNYFAWSMIVTLTLSVMLSWGKYFTPLTDFFIYNVPFYDKFRSVASILVNAELIIPLMGMLGLNHLIKNIDNIEWKKIRKAFIISFSITAGFCLLAYIIPTWINSFDRNNEYQELLETYMMYGNNTQEYWASFLNALHPYLTEVRVKIFKADAIRSFLIILLGVTCLWLFAKRIIGANLLTTLLLLIIGADLILINTRYLNSESYVKDKVMENPYTPLPVDQEILKDTALYYRVLNKTAPLDNDPRTSYFHKSLGGYHAAKLGRYQDIIALYLNNDLLLQDSLNPRVVNMLNAKYFIEYDSIGQPVAIQNKNNLGNAWFVNAYKLIQSADSEIYALQNFEPSKEAIIHESFKDRLQQLPGSIDSNASIHLVKYDPNHLTYHYRSTQTQLTVFSEIYYEDGWQAYVDNEPVSHFRVNYILRGMVIPAGNHKVEFKFEPKHFYTAEKISLASSIIFILVFAGYLVKSWRREVGS